MAKLPLGAWVMKELIAAVAIVGFLGSYAHDVIATVGIVLAAGVSAVGGISAAKTARDNRDHRQFTESEIGELHAMLERRAGDRRGGARTTPPGTAPIDA